MAKKTQVSKTLVPKAKNPRVGKPTIKTGKIQKVMHEFKHSTLHSGSKNGPKVTNKKQAVAIAISEARKAGANIPKKRKKYQEK
jgi:hypothetical protein